MPGRKTELVGHIGILHHSLDSWFIYEIKILKSLVLYIESENKEKSLISIDRIHR